MQVDALIAPIAAMYASEAGLPPSQLAAVVKAIIRQESNFDPRAYRPEPAVNDASRGLMQLLGTTARDLGYGGPIGDDRTRTGGLYDPQTSIEYGTRLLTQNLVRAQGDLPIALSVYNAGWSTIRPGDAKRHIDGTFINQPYVDRVLGYLAQYAPTLLTPGSNGVTQAAVDSGAAVGVDSFPPWAWVLLGIGAVGVFWKLARGW